MKTKSLGNLERDKVMDQLIELCAQHSEQNRAINKLTNVNSQTLLLNKKEIETRCKMQTELRELIWASVQEASYYKVPRATTKYSKHPESNCYIVDIDVEEDDMSDLELHCYIDSIEGGIRHFNFFRVSFVIEAGMFDYDGFFKSARGYGAGSEEEFFHRFSNTIGETYLDNIVSVVNSATFRMLYRNKKMELATLNVN
ncbi:hypothetical protein WKH56_09360 [Priestia sp. SB1]|uniref:Uncharacterized protein n=1 Tax=Priestia aryabhattai TaxID=412384 RepID=A0AAX6NEB0_PRIAR|nr:hypothetical protein [Priestia aryabhattai]MDU9693845.1 hypothetical protein [Priestia aryabhattai]